MSSSGSILAQLRQASKAAETSQTAVIAPVPVEPVAPTTALAQPTAPVDLKSIPALASLADHLMLLAAADNTFRDKLIKQSALFQCPQWCGVPSVGLAHLEVHREGVIIQNLWVNRFPFYLVGRDRRCDFVMEHPSVSSVHCAILFHKERQCFVVMDLGSTNGVLLNGTKIEAKKPQGITFETVLQFGHSTRSYILKKTEPRKEHARPVEKTADGSRAVVGKEGAVAAVAPTGTTTKEGVASLPSAVTSTDANAADEPRGETKPVEAPAPVVQRHLRHLLIKHKDVAKPVSAAARNKGEAITRSREDAVNLANAIRALHANWTEELFAEACKEHGEDFRANSGGDLGIVSRGDFSGSFDVAAFAIGIEHVSLPVETQLGVHLIFRCRE